MDLRSKLDVLGWTQKQFAEKVGVSENTVSGWCVTGGAPKVVGLYLDLLTRVRSLQE